MEDIFSIELGLWEWILFAVVGVLTGVINTLAGSGSLITLPIFIFLCGLPPTVANGTNRIGALIQSGAGVLTYKQTGKFETKGVAWLVVPSILGAIVGALIATDLNEKVMNYTIGGLMVFMLIVLLLNPKRWIRETEAEVSRNKHPMTIMGFFLIGIYGGFIQAGIGIFLLAAMVLGARYSLVASNGIKLLIVFIFNIPTLFIFFYYNQVHVGLGLTMAVFQAIGAVLGVKTISKLPNANVWIHRLLIVIVIASAIKFFVK
ncbi:MAG: sulfite exporter TauE/SafE family protein [Bacteroidetes bacterium]|nr:sulfite exporter TauE/SafE family protein [Bacteroidota bacterium]